MHILSQCSVNGKKKEGGCSSLALSRLARNGLGMSVGAFKKDVDEEKGVS